MTTKKRSALARFRFSNFARTLAVWTGRPAAFIGAAGIVLAWALSGPLFGFSDTWQLIINTGTTVVTFLMVFLIQNTQNRDTEAIQIKLDELIRATQGAHNALLALEQLEDKELEKYLDTYAHLAAVARERLRRGEVDTDSPDTKTLKRPPG
jgi:low affinity Fe/Cu permease